MGIASGRRVAAPPGSNPRSILDLIGHTPLIPLNRVAKGYPYRILAKLEYLNPGGSVKDRIGPSMVDAAEAKGLLKPGGTIIEATSGNTGVGLALVAAVRGYHAVFVIPDKMSSEKIRLLRAFGARVVITPSQLPPDHPMSHYSVAKRLSKEIPNSYYPNQYRESRESGRPLPNDRAGDRYGGGRVALGRRGDDRHGRHDQRDRAVLQGTPAVGEGHRGRPEGVDSPALLRDP